MMFRIFNHEAKEAMTYGDLQAFFKFSWLFQNYDTNGDHTVNDIEIMEGIKSGITMIPLNGVEKQIQAELSDWLGGKRGFAVNIKEFCAWFRYRINFDQLKAAGM